MINQHRALIIIFFLVFVFGCKTDKVPVKGETAWQKKMNDQFKDASTSPLTETDLKSFKGLEFFKQDSLFVVKAELKRTPDSQWFDMKTTTERLSKERIYGIATFELMGQVYQLNVYQGQEHLETVGMENHLFLPFLDLTNGDSTYGGGRYLDLKIPNGDILIVDFNKAYNPYCVYNEKFSCPLVPRENFMAMEVKAGMKIYKSD